MSFSDSEALPDAPRAAFADHGPPRCRSAPCRLLPGMDLEDLEQMTSEAIELFRKGQQQAALDLAVDFSKNAEMLLGRSHPVNVNALATVAALAEQMGCRREAEELLQEAEELHQEHLEDMDDLATESSRSHSRSSQSSEAAAEGIEHLTWEVQELLKDGHPELAAKLLSEAEVSVLAGGQENPTLHYLKKASLHTLWAAVLEDIGEKDKAAKLYDEALTCLRHDEPQHLDSCTSSDASHRTSHSGGSGGSASAESFKVPPEQQVLLPLEEKMKLLMEREEPEQKTCLEAAHEPQQLREAELPKPEALSGIPEPPKPEASSPAKAKGAEPSQSSAYEPSTPAPAPAPDVTVVISAVKSLASQVSPAPQPPRASPSTPTPATPATPATSPPKAAPATPPKATPKRRPPPLAPKATPLATAVRVGGGFKLPKAPPKASSAKAAPRKVKAKAKAKTVETVETVEMETETPTQETPEPSKEELGARLTEAAKKAMVTADHFLGLAKFDRAADVLEDQLMEISSDNCPLRNSNLHIELLEKYGGILWWDGDLESAIDAYAAADEVLTERGADSGTGSDPQLLMRRAKIWSLVAQIHRKSGDLEAADRHLQAAMHSLEVLPKMPSGSDKTYSPMALDDLLRDLQAALGQVCVEKKEYSRAQELYLMAFSPQKPAETFSLTASENV